MVFAVDGFDVGVLPRSEFFFILREADKPSEDEIVVVVGIEGARFIAEDVKIHA